VAGNEQQIEYWNGPSGERWAALAETTERSMGFITPALIAFAAAKSGERVADIGCGCGATSLALSKLVGPGGSITGVDISRPMLAVARERTRGIGQISLVEADASAHDFKPKFDLGFSRFGVMFFADPAAAFANIRNGLLGTGRLAFACWRSLGENVWAERPLQVTRDLLPPQPPADPHAPGPFAYADGERIVSILKQAGFTEAHADKLDTVMNMGATIEDAVKASLSIGPLARIAGEQSDATREKLKERIREALRPFRTPAGIAPPAACWLVGARA
jgi:SAM-dependent methyltransferase